MREKPQMFAGGFASHIQDFMLNIDTFTVFSLLLDFTNCDNGLTSVSPT